jgi:hypothetical protein
MAALSPSPPRSSRRCQWSAALGDPYCSRSATPEARFSCQKLGRYRCGWRTAGDGSAEPPPHFRSVSRRRGRESTGRPGAAHEEDHTRRFPARGRGRHCELLKITYRAIAKRIAQCGAQVVAIPISRDRANASPSPPAGEGRRMGVPPKTPKDAGTQRGRPLRLGDFFSASKCSRSLR